MEDEEINLLKDYTKWVKKNWITMLAIIIIMVAVYIDVSTVGKQKMEIVNDCNEHWKNKLRERYPDVVEDGGWLFTDLSEDINENENSDQD